MHVDLVSESHHESLTDLLCELYSYYNEASTIPRAAVRDHLLTNLLGAGSPHRLVVASREDGRVVGLAAITLVYSIVDPTLDKARQCQLKELYVRASERGRGTGRALMAWVAGYATDHGCCRIDWPVQASNAKGISFYESIGAERVVDRLSYRLAGRNLDALAHVQR